MTTSTRRRYEHTLRRAREQSLLVVVAAISGIDRRARRHSAGSPESAADAIEAEIDAIIADQEQQTLVDIDAALRHIEQEPDTFGLCIVCGAIIPAERLAIAPWEERCDAHSAVDIR